nr:EAL domain-containing protein [Microvirga solisilvae]
MHDALTELRFSAAPRNPTGSIVVVEIDAKSIAAIGQWPWPRRIHADLIRAIDRLDPSEIALDIDFSARSSEADDAALEAALREARSSVTLATFHQKATSDADETSIVANLPLTRFRDHAWLATVNVEPDSDGAIRRYPYGAVIDGKLMPSIGSLYGGVAAADGSFVIDYSIAAERIERISVIDLLQGRAQEADVKGRKVIVGASAIELRDIFQVPSHGLISGSLLQAIGAEALLQKRALQMTGQWVTIVGLIMLAAFAMAIARFRWSHVLLVLLSGAAGLEVLALALQVMKPLVVDTSAWHVALLGYAVVAVGREIDLRRILLVLANRDRANIKTILDQVVADSFDGIVVVDDEGVVQSISRSAAQILQPRRRRNWIGFPAKELVPPEMANAMRDAITECQKGTWQAHTPREMHLRVDGNQERVIEYIITPSKLETLESDPSSSGDRFAVSVSFRDITERRAAEQRLEYQARYDTLTGLSGRNHFMESLRDAAKFADAERPSGCVLYFDLDRFKTVNDTFGHATGDQLLQAVARRGLEIISSPHLLARFGGDEFAVLWRGPHLKDELDVLASRLIEQLSDPYEINGNRLAIGASIGIAMIEPGEDAESLMRKADVALYRAKKTGKGVHCFYEASLEASLRARQKMETELWEAMTRQEFHVAYQPQYDLKTRTLVGVEALLRWQHPERGLVSPAEFIPVAEEIGLMEALGEWVLIEACKDAASWPKPIKVAVNVSPVQFARGDLAKAVEKILTLTGLPANRLVLEITETIFIQENGAVRRAMDVLRSKGVSFALDDFGTGYSSLSYLREFSIDTIKIDRSFVRDIPNDAGSMAIVQAVIALGRGLDMRLMAEGVETPEQIEALRQAGCDEGQGYGLGRPQPASQIAGLLA